MSTLTDIQAQGNIGNIDLVVPIDKVKKILDGISNQANISFGMVLLYPRLWMELVRLNKNLSRFEQKIPMMKFESPEEQKIAEILPEKFLNLSEILFRCADLIQTVSENSNWRIFQYINKKFFDLMEDIACSLEDYAEILVLVSNKGFLKEIQREFEAVENKSQSH